MLRNVWRGRKVGGGWCYGDLCSRNLDGRVYIRVLDLRENAGRTVRLCAVEPDTVGEYTGATDCNGTPVFEGDVCELWYADCPPDEVKHIVIKWAECGFFIAVDDENDEPLELSMSQFIRVIGNIHDNPNCAAWRGCSTCVYAETWMEDFDGVYRCDRCDTLTGRRGNCPYWSDGTDEPDEEEDDEEVYTTKAHRRSRIVTMIAGAAFRITERKKRYGTN